MIVLDSEPINAIINNSYPLDLTMMLTQLTSQSRTHMHRYFLLLMFSLISAGCTPTPAADVSPTPVSMESTSMPDATSSPTPNPPDTMSKLIPMPVSVEP